MNQAQTSIFLALTIGVIGGIGTWLSGRLADRLGGRDPKLRIGLVVAVILLAKPFVIAFLLIEPRNIALACCVFSAAVADAFWSPTFAYLHSRLNADMRPMATAIYVFVFNLIGVSIGPTLVGIANDTVFAGYGANSLA